MQQSDVNKTWSEQVEVNGKGGVFSFDSGVGNFKPPPSVKWFRSTIIGDPTISEEGLKHLDEIGEAYLILLAERQSITGPVDQAPLTLFIAPGVMESFLIAETDEKPLNIYKKRISKNKIDPEQFDKIVFLNRVPSTDHYILSVFTIDEFDETAPRIEIYHTFSDGNKDGKTAIKSFVEEQHKFVVGVLGKVVEISSSSQTIHPFTSPITRLRKLKVDEYAKLISLTSIGTPPFSIRDSFAATVVMAQFISYTTYHDDNRFLHVEEFRKQNLDRWQSELATNIQIGAIAESDLSKRIVHLPQNARELESLTMWPHSRILHPMEQNELALLFFSNEQIWTGLTTNEEQAKSYRQFLIDIRKLPETEEEKTVPSNALRQPVPTAHSPKDDQARKKQTDEMVNYYRRVGPFFAAHAHQTGKTTNLIGNYRCSPSH